jgi:hypothetical protein
MGMANVLNEERGASIDGALLPEQRYGSFPVAIGFGGRRKWHWFPQANEVRWHEHSPEVHITTGFLNIKKFARLRTPCYTSPFAW